MGCLIMTMDKLTSDQIEKMISENCLFTMTKRETLQQLADIMRDNARCKAIIRKFCNEFPYYAKWFGADEVIDLSNKESDNG